MTAELIKFEIETQKVVQLLAKQIYQSPLALLRENTQNAFDAIRLRLHKGDQFEPRIDVDLAPDSISIADNGIGMTRDDLRKHYWRAGSSGKNNDEARAAGVVGTFGVGAMANFGIASELEVITESLSTGERTRSFARRDELSTSKECISIEDLQRTGSIGTVVIARSDSPVNVLEAVKYLKGFVSHVPFPVSINNEVVSQRSYEGAVPQVEGTREETTNKEICR